MFELGVEGLVLLVFSDCKSALAVAIYDNWKMHRNSEWFKELSNVECLHGCQ